MLRLFVPLAGLVCLALALAACGGSSSETPPPLEPLPANVHYNRAATTLPGELGSPSHPAPTASAEPGAGQAKPQPSAAAPH